MKKRLSEERLYQLLDIVFPTGFTTSECRNNDLCTIWFLGWFKGNICIPLSVNLDGCGSSIVFHWYKVEDDEMTEDMLIGYIQGMMESFEPEMKYNNRGFEDGLISFAYEYEEEIEDTSSD